MPRCIPFSNPNVYYSVEVSAESVQHLVYDPVSGHTTIETRVREMKMKQTFECWYCGREWRVQNDKFPDGTAFTGRCNCNTWERNSSKCVVCNEVIYGTRNDNVICEECADSKEWKCYNCGSTHDREDAYITKIAGRRTSVILCHGCYHEMNECHHCDTRMHEDDTYYINDTILCRNCWEENGTTCYECGENLWRDDANYRRGEYYCDECCDNVIIRNYSYKPDPVFHSCQEDHKGLFMGVELEIDCGGCNDDSASAIASISGTRAYFKEDGSLEDGFEIVTHPMTYEYHLKEFPWEKILRKCRDMDYDNPGTCGVHVHVSKRFFGRNYQVQDENMAKFATIVHNNWTKLLLFAERTNTGYCRNFSDILNYPNCDKFQFMRENTEHHHCVNIENDNTLEFRIFNGTLSARDLFSYLEMTKSLCEISLESWEVIEDVNMRFLYNYAVEKGYKYMAEVMRQRIGGLVCA